MSISYIVLIVICVTGFAILIAAAIFGSSCNDDLNKKLCAVLDNSVIAPKYWWGRYYIEGSYRGYPVTIEWARLGYGRIGDGGANITAYIKIYDINIPMLEKNFQPYLSETESTTTANLWRKLTALPNVQKISLADHILEVKTQWGIFSGTGSAIFFDKDYVKQVSDDTNADHIAQSMSTILNQLLEVSQSLC